MSLAERPAAFALLGLRSGATRAEITRAYHRLARLTHPDVCPEPGAAQRFARLNSAYRTASASAPAGDVAASAAHPPARVHRPDLRIGPVRFTPWPTSGPGGPRWS